MAIHVNTIYVYCHVELRIANSFLRKYMLLGRVALVRGAAAYSDHTFAWTICRCVGLSSALWKTADRIRMLFGIIGRTGPGMRVGPREEVLLGSTLGRAIITNGDLRRTCATVPQPSELRFGSVHAVGRGIAVLEGSVHVVQGEGRFGVLFLFSQWEMPLGRRRLVLELHCAWPWLCVLA